MPQDTLPSLEAVPVSCYSGSFRTWATDNDMMAELEDSEVEESRFDDEFFPEEVELAESMFETDHYNIDTSPKTSRRSKLDDRTLAEIGIQTESTLSLTAADVTWTPTIKSFIVKRNIDTSGMSTLDRAIFAQECDDLQGFTEQQ